MSNLELSDNDLKDVNGGVNYYVGKRVKVSKMIGGKLTFLGFATVIRVTPPPERAQLDDTDETIDRCPGQVYFDDDGNPND